MIAAAGVSVTATFALPRPQRTIQPPLIKGRRSRCNRENSWLTLGARDSAGTDFNVGSCCSGCRELRRSNKASRQFQILHAENHQRLDARVPWKGNAGSIATIAADGKKCKIKIGVFHHSKGERKRAVRRRLDCQGCGWPRRFHGTTTTKNGTRIRPAQGTTPRAAACGHSLRGR